MLNFFLFHLAITNAALLAIHELGEFNNIDAFTTI